MESAQIAKVLSISWIPGGPSSHGKSIGIKLENLALTSLSMARADMTDAHGQLPKVHTMIVQ